MSATRVYTLDLAGGRFTNRSVNYQGVRYRVAATSIKQAYHLAYNKVWAIGPDPFGLGILHVYTRGAQPDHLLFNGAGCYGVVPPKHGVGRKAIIEWMREVSASEIPAQTHAEEVLILADDAENLIGSETNLEGQGDLVRWDENDEWEDWS